MKLAALAIMLAPPVSAQKFSLLAGCEAYLTVQNSDCVVSHYFRCAEDLAGEQNHVSFPENNTIYMGTIDQEAQWIFSHHIADEITETLELTPFDRASFSDLMAMGVDDFDFRTMSPEVGVTRYVGRDTLTGNQVVIDGVTLDETLYDLTAYLEDGSQTWQSQGHEFISRDRRMFLSGKGSITTLSDTFETDGTPVQFITPGEPGFLSIKPEFGCGVLMSVAPELQEYSHDSL